MSSPEAIGGLPSDKWEGFIQRARDASGLPDNDQQWQSFIEQARVTIGQTLARGHYVSKDSASHPDVLAEIGAEWQQIRLTDGGGMSIQEAAQRSGVWWGDVILLEEGFLDVRDREPDFLDKIAAAYGVPELATGFKVLHSLGGYSNSEKIRRRVEELRRGKGDQK